MSALPFPSSFPQLLLTHFLRNQATGEIEHFACIRDGELLWSISTGGARTAYRAGVRFLFAQSDTSFVEVFFEDPCVPGGEPMVRLAGDGVLHHRLKAVPNLVAVT